MAYKKKKWKRVTIFRTIKIKNSPILICECGQRFIEIKEDIQRGYKRVKCPFCEPYKHWERDNHFVLK
jgi:hypothetical protein